jgi:hypothetical protein
LLSHAWSSFGSSFYAPDPARLRITIEPLADHRARQKFEESRDGGKTWRTVFNAEHRAH